MSHAALRALAERWADAQPAERANYQLYLTELCEALEVERPRPAGTGYQFEQPVRVVNRDGTETTNFIDLYKQGHFVLEAKDQSSTEPESKQMVGAFGQARTYAAAVAGDPPPKTEYDRAKSLVRDLVSLHVAIIEAVKEIDVLSSALEGARAGRAEAP